MRLLKKFDHILKYKIWPTFLCALFVLLVSFLVTQYYPFSSKYSGSEKEVSGYVLKYIYDGNQAKILLKGKEKLWVYYYFASENQKSQFIEKVHLGDMLSIIGTMEEPSENTVPYTFHYKNYLYTQKIYYIMKTSSIKKTKNNTSILYAIKEKIYKKMDTYQDTTKEYLYTFILGNKDILDSNRKKIYQQNGISHLFSISGMHISLFTMVLFKFIKKLSYNIRFQHYFVILVLFLYMLIVEISPSIVRTVLMFTCFSFNKIYRLHYKKENLLLCIFIIMMLVNPFYLYNVGFWLSYLISSILVLQSSKLSQCKNYFVKALMISWISFLISFPIVIYNYCEVNFFSIILNLIVVPFVSIIIFPLSLFTFLFPFLEGTFLFFISILERLSIFVSHFPTTFVFKKMSFIFLIFYYIVIAAIFYNKKFFILFILMLLIHKNITYFDSSGMVSIMDVGQGDCIFIRLPYNQGNILIDTGGVFLYKKESWQEKENEYHLMENTIIPYLKALGVEKLQYLILTHGGV